MKYDKKTYRQILEHAVGEGFQFVDYTSVDVAHNACKQIILRHDIDCSPAMALEMAEIDASYNIKSTFAVLISSHLYNPFTPANIKIIDSIHANGHYIALHHRVIPGQSEENIQRDIIRNMQIMKKYFSYILPVFIWHDPQNNLLSRIEVPNMINAYGSEFTQKMLYISDSVARHTPEEFLDAIKKERFIHLLLHPIIWISENGSTVARVSHLFTRIIRECESEFAHNWAWTNRYPNGIPQEALDNLEEALTRDQKQ